MIILAATLSAGAGPAGPVDDGELSGWSAIPVGVQANGLAYDPSRDVVYASVAGWDSQHGNEVVAVDPRSGAILASVWVGSEPRELAVSSDGSVLYVALGGATQIARVDLETFELLEPWTLPVGEYPFGTLFAEDIAAQPGNPDVVVVSLANPAFSARHWGVAVLDGGTLRPAMTQAHIANSITFGADASTVYGYDNEISSFELSTMTVAEDGIHLTSQLGLSCCYYNKIEFSEGRIYSSSGVVIDPVQNTLVGTYGASGAVEPSPADDRTYMLTGTTLLAFHRTQFTLVDTFELPLPELPFSTAYEADLVATGDGLAALTTDGQLAVVGPSVTPPFSDVGGDPHAEAIGLVAGFGIVTGYPDGTYRPGQVVTRGQMASFLARALDLDPFVGAPLFSDISGDVHEPAIGAVAQVGIALGYSDGTFRPGQAITREQMATFLTRALDLPIDVPPPPFPDATGPHADGIAAIYDAGITQGMPDGTFGASLPVTRGQMATFLARGLGLMALAL